MSLIESLEYALVGAIVLGCAVLLWRRITGTAKGKDTLCGCEGKCCLENPESGVTQCPTARTDEPDTPDRRDAA